MKQNLIYICLALTAMLSASCEESLPNNFEQIEGVYFNNQQTNRTHIDKTALTFVYENKDEIDVPVTVQLMGRISDVDRPVSIRVRSEDAVEGIDYELKVPSVLPAGSATFDYIVTLKRTEILQTQVKTLIVELEANDQFIVPFTTITHTDGTKTSTISYQIEFSNQFTAPPIGWGADFVGEFSQQKFELIARVMNIPRADFNEKGKITSARWMYIASKMGAYVREQSDLKAAGQDYDAEAFDENGDPLSFKPKKD